MNDTRTPAERLEEQGFVPGTDFQTVGDLLNEQERTDGSTEGVPRPDGRSLPFVPTPAETPSPLVSAGEPPPAKGSVLGDNQPPEPTPFEAIRQEIEDLHDEAKNWLDGEPIANGDQAEKVGKLRDLIRDAEKRADALRKAEAKPFDEGKAEVQARYNPLVQKDRGICDLAIRACNAALSPYLRKIDDEQRATALKAQRHAQEEHARAQEAARAAAGSTDLGTREDAEGILKDAETAARDARAADRAKPQVGGLARAIGLRSVYRAELVDPKAALSYFRETQPGRLKDWMIDQAQALVRSGHKGEDSIPGFKVIEDKVPA